MLHIHYVFCGLNWNIILDPGGNVFVKWIFLQLLTTVALDYLKWIQMWKMGITAKAKLHFISSADSKSKMFK